MVRPSCFKMAALRALFLLLLASPASGHFVFVVPGEDQAATIVFSESLEPDSDVDHTPLLQLTLAAECSDGKAHPLQVTNAGEACRVVLPETTRRVRGRLDYGVMSRGGSEPFLLAYHPKTIFGHPFGESQDELAEGVQLSLTGRPGEARFVLRHDGRPVAGAAVRVVLPDGTEEELVTGEDGATPAISARGRLGGWARHTEEQAGEHDGKPYGMIRHYPTLVADIPTEETAQPAGRETAQPLGDEPATKTTFLAPLPEAASSLGAVSSDGFAYVYGGHISPVHDYSTAGVSGRFHRLPLATLPDLLDGTADWQELPGGPALQGMNLAAHGGCIYRVGGMEPRNPPGEETDNHSVASVACFDPAEGRWSPLPDLPEARSSHDVAVIGDTLYVVGGWTMEGEQGETWADTMLALDLSGDPVAADGTAVSQSWKILPQPFMRRALIAAVADGRLFVLGGFTDADEPSLQVDVYDPASGIWSRGPDLPGDGDRGGFNGFAPAACTVDEAVYVSLADGGVHRLLPAATAWEPVATVSPRIVHRMVPHGSNGVILLGGAHRRDNLDRVERVPLP